MIKQYWADTKALVWNSVWGVNLAGLSPIHVGAVRMARVGHMVIRELADGQLNVRAASLVYTTLLSLVPVLALSFALFKGFGIHHDLAPALISYLEPLGEQGVEFGNRLIEMVESVPVGKHGIMGLVFLLYAVARVVPPVARALIGKEVDDTVKVRVPKGDREFDVLQILIES